MVRNTGMENAKCEILKLAAPRYRKCSSCRISLVYAGMTKIRITHWSEPAREQSGIRAEQEDDIAVLYSRLAVCV